VCSICAEGDGNFKGRKGWPNRGNANSETLDDMRLLSLSQLRQLHKPRFRSAEILEIDLVAAASYLMMFLLKSKLLIGVLAAVAATAPTAWGKRAVISGFDVGNALIPSSKILSGGPGKDGIPAIDHPKFIPADAVRFLQDREMIVSLTVGDDTRGYPVRVLNWHEIVNDRIGDFPFVVTYCPLCGTAMVFDRRYGASTLSFGVSGLLYNSNVLLYDRESESLWSQLAVKAVAGPMAGTPLKWIPSEMMDWRAWKNRYPHGMVLSQDTGFDRDYRRSPYADYSRSSNTLFPVPFKRREFKKKDWVVVGNATKAYLMEALSGEGRLLDTIGGRRVAVEFVPENGPVRFTDVISGEIIPHVVAYWFAWQAFYSETSVWDKSTGSEP